MASMWGEPLKLAVLASHPIQYQAPWFRALAEVVDLEVFYCHRQDAAGQAAAGFGVPVEWDIPLLDGYSYRWLENVSRRPGVDAFSGCDTPGIGAALQAGGFDACLVNGWYLKSCLQAIRACRQQGIPVLVRGDSQLKTFRPWTTRIAKYWPYRWFLSKIDAHLYVGRANYAYLRHYGVKERRLFFVPHCVENERFAERADRARGDGSAALLRAKHGAATDDVVFLFTGKLIEKKRPADFVDAVALLGARGIPARGFIVGSGPLEGALRRQTAERGAPVHFLGFQNQSTIPVCYAAADCLVLPSDGGETWGLVVNEAMACGVPAIVSDAVGCADDMILEGETGFTFPCGDVGALAGRMQTYVTNAARSRGRFAHAASQRSAHYAIGLAVAGTLQALQCVVGSRFARLGEKAHL
ncbi:MAG: glycosyltransferase family 4 protein [Vicinamibacterales bacterium]